MNSLAIAYKKIFYRWYGPVFGYAQKIVGEHDDAEDIAQHVFLKLWEAGETVILAESPQGWLFHLAKNAAIDVLRKRRRNPIIALEDAHDLLLVEVLVRENLAETMRQLGPQCRKVFIFSYLQGFTSKEISRILHISRQTVRNQQARAVRILNQKLENQ